MDPRNESYIERMTNGTDCFPRETLTTLSVTRDTQRDITNTRVLSVERSALSDISMIFPV